MGPSITIDHRSTPAGLPVEVVERKGIGHPDTLADALAERMSVAYSRHCRDRFGAVLHHNLDKLYLRGGHAHTGLGQFKMTEPTLLVIGGRISSSFAGEPIAYRELFETVARDYLATVLPHFDVDKWLHIQHATTDRSRFPTWFRPRGLDDLPELRQPTGSDTVAVTAWWPLTPTERLVLSLERYLNKEATGPRYPHLGQDIKVMAVRRGRRVIATVNVAVHPSAAPTVNAYESVLALLWPELMAVAEQTVGADLEVNVCINTQVSNPYAAKRQYLLGSGTCLEFGEEGFVGRGNGASGLIAVHRPKSVEAAFGKNPTYHSGKVYSLYGEQIAREVHVETGAAATVTIVSGNSIPLRDPTYVAVDLDGDADVAAAKIIVNRVLETTDHVALAVDEGRLIPR